MWILLNSFAIISFVFRIIKAVTSAFTCISRVEYMYTYGLFYPLLAAMSRISLPTISVSIPHLTSCVNSIVPLLCISALNRTWNLIPLFAFFCPDSSLRSFAERCPAPQIPQNVIVVITIPLRLLSELSLTTAPPAAFSEISS